jgi:hypothetical protein
MNNKKLLEAILEEGYSTTENPLEAIYIMTDGTMIWGDFDLGMRGTDHRMIEYFVDGLNRYDGNKFWEVVHLQYGLVRTVPESMIALIKEGQELTEAQKRIIEEAGYEIEIY